MAGEIAKFDDVYIPNIDSFSETPQLLADESRTADNTLQRDIAGNGTKRQWKITASKLTPAEWSAIWGLLAGKHHGAVAFWLESFGDESVTVQAYVTVENNTPVSFARDGTWYKYGRNVELTITEK